MTPKCRPSSGKERSSASQNPFKDCRAALVSTAEVDAGKVVEEKVQGLFGGQLVNCGLNSYFVTVEEER